MLFDTFLWRVYGITTYKSHNLGKKNEDDWRFPTGLSKFTLFSWRILCQKTHCNLPSKEAWELFASVKRPRNLAETIWGWVQRAKNRRWQKSFEVSGHTDKNLTNSENPKKKGDSVSSHTKWYNYLHYSRQLFQAIKGITPQSVTHLTNLWEGLAFVDSLTGGKSHKKSPGLLWERLERS